MYKLYNICKLAGSIVIRNYLPTVIKFQTIASNRILYIRLKVPSIHAVNNNKLLHKHLRPSAHILALSILGWLGFIDDDEDKESELIMTLKRAVLCTQREQYDTAEKLLHVALRLSQQQQNQQGIIYSYDLMANLAMDQQQLDKAEKLFISIMQMLLSNGMKEDDLKMIHISLKMARICHLKAEEEKAEIGYKWCLEKIENQRNKSVDSQALYGVIQDWYAQYLLDKGDVENSLKHLKEAYYMCCEVKGKNDEQSMLLLNDLGITSWRAGDMETAVNFLNEAIAIGKTIADPSHVGVVYANLGLLYLEKGFADLAQKHCKEAWNLGRKYENTESIEQANYCFEQIKLNVVK